MKPLPPLHSDSDDSSAVRAARQRRKNFKRTDRPNTNPSTSNGWLATGEHGSASHADKGKGRDRPGYSGWAASPIARPVSKSTSTSNNNNSNTTSAVKKMVPKRDSKPEVIEISSSEPEVEELDPEVVKLRRELADLKLQLAAAVEKARRPPPKTQQPTLEVKLAKAQKDTLDLTLERDELKKARQKDREFQDAVQNALQCHVCFNLLSRPYALNPCGHVCCLTCLQDWFKSASDDDGGNKPNEKKCPYCRASIQRKPVELFLIKSLVTALALVDEQVAKDIAETGPSQAPTSANAQAEDPWKGIFSGSNSSLSSSSSEESISDSDQESLYDSDDGPHCENCGSPDVTLETGCMDCGHPMLFSDSDHRDDDDIERISESEDDNLIAPPGAFSSWLVRSDEEDRPGHDEDEDNSDNDVLEDAHSSFGADSDRGRDGNNDHGPSVGDWTYASWSPRFNPVSRTLLSHLSDDEYVVCCRGVPYAMMQKFEITYTHSRGLCAKVSNQGEDSRGMGVLWLGWNVTNMDRNDLDGSEFIDNILNEMIIRPERYVIIRSAGSAARRIGNDNTVWTAWKLVRRYGVDDVDYGSDAESV